MEAWLEQQRERQWFNGSMVQWLTMGQRDWIPKWPEIEESSDIFDIEAPEHHDGENLMDFKRNISKTTTSKHEDLLSVWMVMIVEYEGELFPGSSIELVHDLKF